MSAGSMPSRMSSSTSAPTSSASARSPPASSSRTAPFGGAPRRPRLVQPALEVVQRRRGRRRRSAPRAPGRWTTSRASGAQLLHRRRAAGEGDAARLVGQRDAHVGLGVADERLHRVELRRREVVEAVEEDRPRAPRRGRGAQRVERRPGVAVPVRAAERLEPAPVRRVQRRQLARRRRRARPPSVGRPGAQRGVKRAGDTSERCSSANSAPAATAKPGVAAEPASTRSGTSRHRGAHDAVARDAAERPRRQPGARRDLPRPAARR